MKKIAKTSFSNVGFQKKQVESYAMLRMRAQSYNKKKKKIRLYKVIARPIINICKREMANNFREREKTNNSRKKVSKEDMRTKNK